MTVVLIGGGGGGGLEWGNGGGSGFLAYGWFVVSSAVAVTVGAGGFGPQASGSSSAPGGAGGVSSFGSYLTANGGLGGLGGNQPCAMGTTPVGWSAGGAVGAPQGLSAS